MAIESLRRFSAAPSPDGLAHRPSPAWTAVARTELILRLRDTNLPIVLTCVAAACILLTPPAGANYAVITFGGMKPIMSAGTSVVAAGIVLSLLMLPIYMLGLGVGCSRDRRLGTGAVLATSPVDPIGLLGGRLAANALLVTLFTLVALVLIMVVTASRFKSLPDVISVAAYFLVVVPAGFCSLPVSALIDRYLGDDDRAKAVAAITLWSLLMVFSVVAWPDAFGLLLLKQNAPGGSTGADFSVGIVVAEHMGQIPWKAVALLPSFVAGRLWLLAALVVLSGLVCILARPGMMRALSRAPERTCAGATAPVIAAAGLPRFRPAPIGRVSAAFVLWRRWFTGANWICGLFAATLVVALLVPQSPRLALGLALLVPLSIVNVRRISGEPHLRQFELSTAALWSPSPLLFTSLVLAASTAVPVLPVLAHLPHVRSIHVLVGIVGAALWLTWTCAGMARPLFGISVYALVWYLELFGDIPPAADLLGLGATSIPSFAGALGLTIILCVLAFRKDSYALRSSRHV